MAEAGASSGGACCGGGGGSADAYEYGPQAFVVGSVETIAGPVPTVSTKITGSDRFGALKVRMNVRRDQYRVEPGLYAVGAPDDLAPVLVSANYKLSFDRLRSTLAGMHAWILVLDTKGINVWCAAGKGTFGTMELVRKVISAQLDQVVSHSTLIVPQLGATGIAAEQVRMTTGFRVLWGPVDVADLPEFIGAGNKATDKMRRVGFSLKDRAVLVPVEFSFAWRPEVILGLLLGIFAPAVMVAVGLEALAPAFTIMGGAMIAGFIGGTVLTPILLPWIPGRAFALKGAIVGVILGALVAAIWPDADGYLTLSAIAISMAVSSFTAMNFTGCSTYTSPSGVEWEMRRWVPVQAVSAALGLVIGVVHMVGSL